MFGRFILASDFLWIFTWFGIAVWFEADASLPFPYRENIRDILFHYANVGGVVYVLKANGYRISWFGLIPFAFALLGDVQHLVSVIINLSRDYTTAWGLFLGLSIWALVNTLCGIVYFLSTKWTKKI